MPYAVGAATAVLTAALFLAVLFAGALYDDRAAWLLLVPVVAVLVAAPLVGRRRGASYGWAIVVGGVLGAAAIYAWAAIELTRMSQ